jgi:hypothetical protein
MFIYPSRRVKPGGLPFRAKRERVVKLTSLATLSGQVSEHRSNVRRAH